MAVHFQYAQKEHTEELEYYFWFREMSSRWLNIVRSHKRDFDWWDIRDYSLWLTLPILFVALPLTTMIACKVITKDGRRKGITLYNKRNIKQFEEIRWRGSK